MFHKANEEYLPVNVANDNVQQHDIPRNAANKWDVSSFDVLVPNTYRIIGETAPHFLGTVSWHVEVTETGRVTIDKSVACVSRENFDVDVSSTFCIPEPPL